MKKIETSKSKQLYMYIHLYKKLGIKLYYITVFYFYLIASSDLHVEEYESAQVELSVKESIASIENIEREISSLLVTQNELKNEVMSKEVEKRSLIQEG